MIVLILTLFILASQIQAEPTIDVDKNLKHEPLSRLHQTISTNDNGLALLFSSLGNNWVVKTSKDGDSLWTATLPDDRKASYHVMSETTQGNLLLLGSEENIEERIKLFKLPFQSTYTSTPETRRRHAVFCLLSQSGEISSETIIQKDKFPPPLHLLPSATGWWAIFWDMGQRVNNDIITVGAFNQNLEMIHFDLSGSISWTEKVTLPTIKLWANQTAINSNELWYGLNHNTPIPFRYNPTNPPRELAYVGRAEFEWRLEQIGRDTLYLEFVTINPNTCKHQTDLISRYEDMIGKNLTEVYQLGYNFWFCADSNSATSIENRLIYPKEGSSKRYETNHFIINDWDKSGKKTKRSIVDIEFDYDKYSIFENRSVHKSGDNSFVFTGEIGIKDSGIKAYSRKYYIMKINRNGLEWFWTYEDPPWNLSFRSATLTGSILTLVLYGYQPDNSSLDYYKILKLQI